MRPSHKVLKMLQETLPKGSAEKIRNKLLSKNHKFSKQYIYRVLNYDHPDYNKIIIQEALAHAEELKIEKEEIQNRINSLKKKN